MNRDDMQGFFADEAAIDRDAHVVFTYLFETTMDPMEAAARLCQETSTAQWRRPGCDEDFRPAHAAKVLDLETLDESSSSAFDPSARGRFVRAKARIAQPHANFGTGIPNLLTVAMGEGAFFCHGITAIKLIDIELPDSYTASFEGPRFGTAGLRKILNVFDRPIFFGVVKPNIGLSPADFAELARQSWLGGLDAAKDDEMLADTGYSPFAERTRLVGLAMREAEDATGEKKMFIANITAEVDRLRELHDTAVANGVNAVMVNAMAVGLSAVRMLRKHSEVPIVAHFDCIAPMSRHPYFGVETTVLTKLQRLCGSDAIIMPGFGERMMTPEEEVLANAAACSAPMGKVFPALPAPGGSDWAGSLPAMYEKLRTPDFAMVPGRGVFGHPSGPAAGAKSLRQAWEALYQRIDLVDYALDHPELCEAIAFFGGREDASAEIALKDTPPSIHGFTGVTLSFERH